MKNKVHLVIMTVVLAVVASLHSNCAYSCQGPAIVSGGGGGYSSPGGWINGGFSLGPQQSCQPQRRGYPQQRLISGGYQQPCYQQGVQQYPGGYYPQQRQYDGYPQLPNGGFGPGLAIMAAQTVSGGGTAPRPVIYYNTGDTNLRR